MAIVVPFAKTPAQRLPMPDETFVMSAAALMHENGRLVVAQNIAREGQNPGDYLSRRQFDKEIEKDPSKWNSEFDEFQKGQSEPAEEKGDGLPWKKPIG